MSDGAPQGPDVDAYTLKDLAERRRYVESRAARDHWGAAELELVDREARWIATVDRLRDHLPDQQHNETAIRVLQSQLAAEKEAHAETKRKLERYSTSTIYAEIAKRLDAESDLSAALADRDRLAEALREAEPDLAAAYSLCNGTSLPMDMQPMRDRVLRTLDRIRALATPQAPTEGGE